LEKLLKAGIIFSDKYFEWVSNLVPIRKTIGQIRLCVDYCALNRARIKYHFLLPNMEMILQQLPGSQMMSLLDGFFGYNQIKVKRRINIKPPLLLVGAPLLMNVCLLDYLMQVPPFKELCK
jgi:hypothetical protein